MAGKRQAPPAIGKTRSMNRLKNRSPPGILLLGIVPCVLHRETVLPVGMGPVAALGGGMLGVAANRKRSGSRMIAHIGDIVRTSFAPHGPGIAVAVVKDGKVMHCQGYGLANLEWDCLITPDTVFRLGSLSKPFTATAILLLEQQGALRLDDPVTHYLPAYPTHGYTISIEHLLTHTSGIPSYTDHKDFLATFAKLDLPHEEILSLFKDLPLVFEPGTNCGYSNSNYYLLGMIIELASGKSYGEFVHEAIFRPLGMVHSSYLDHERIIPQRAQGYYQRDQGYEHARYISMKPPFAAGALGSTLTDLLLWEAALREGRLLDQHTRQRMFTPASLSSGQRLRYGHSWFIDDYHGHHLVHHGGGISGFTTYYACFDETITVILLANIGQAPVVRVFWDIIRVITQSSQLTGE